MSNQNQSINRPHIEIINDGGIFKNHSYYYLDRNNDYVGFYLGVSSNEYSDGLNNFPSLARNLGLVGTVTGGIFKGGRTCQITQHGNIYQNLDFFMKRVIDDLIHYKNKNTEWETFWNNQKQIIRKEFDKSAPIIGYTRSKQDVVEMFDEQRLVLQKIRNDLDAVGRPPGRSFIPSTRSIVQETYDICNMNNQYIDQNYKQIGYY